MTQQYERDKIKEQERMSEVEFDNFTYTKSSTLSEVDSSQVRAQTELLLQVRSSFVETA